MRVGGATPRLPNPGHIGNSVSMSICRGSSIERGSVAPVRRGGAAGAWLGLACLMALAGCAAGPRRSAEIPASSEVIFGRTNPEAVSDMIAAKCRAVGWAVDQRSAASVTCTVNVPARQRILSSMMMLNPQRQTLLVSHHFILSGAGDEVRVRSESWFSDPDRGRRRELGPAKAAKVGREMAGFLVLMGGQVSRRGD